MKSLSKCFPLLVFVFIIQQADFGVLALEPEDITFYMWTPGGDDSSASPERHVVEVGNWESFEEASFDFDKKTEVYIHGWRNNGTDTYAVHFAKAFLKAGDSNVITVDWSTQSMTMDYPGSVKSVPVVGNRTAEMIKTLVDNDFPVKRVHLSGHSLGAHASGAAGRKIKDDLNELLPRITGMDPAGGDPFDSDSKSRLDKSNGDFVDVIHTNGADGKDGPKKSLYGLLKPIGHADYYANGGQRQKPACIETTDNVANGFCSHLKSIVYVVNSVNNDIYKSCPCDNYKEAVAKRCSTNCRDPVSMGEQIETSSGIFYFETSEMDFIDN